MSSSRVPVVASAAAGAYTLAVVTRMEREYRTNDTFTPVAVAFLYSAYAANGAALTFAARRRTWPLPIPARTARFIGTGIAATAAALTATAMTRFASGAQISGIEPGTLQTGGLYQHSRNPQYLGIVATLVGISVATRSGLAAAITAGGAAVLNRWIRSEEAHLARVFDAEYDSYRQRVRRWI